jgi:hypothetical protein
MRYSPQAFVAAILSGCAASTGILPAGPDTYTVTERFAPIRAAPPRRSRRRSPRRMLSAPNVGENFFLSTC